MRAFTLVLGVLVAAGVVMPATAYAWTAANHAICDSYAISYAGMKGTTERPFAAEFKKGEQYVDAWDGPNSVTNPEYHFNRSSYNWSHNHTIPAPSTDTRWTKWYYHKDQAQIYVNLGRQFATGSSSWLYYMKRAAYHLGMGSHGLQDMDAHGQIGQLCHKSPFCNCDVMRNIDVDNASVAWGGYTGALRLSRSKNRAGQVLYSSRSAMPELFN